MTLAQFIRSSTHAIVDEWAEFALEATPEADVADRRDHIEGMLRAIAKDLETPQTPGEQVEKSKGRDDAHPAHDTAANAHGTDRAATGYTPGQMVSEFRALRASVLRLWSKAHLDVDRASMDDLVRFNEAIDQALTESIAQHALEAEYSKDLFLGILGHDLRNPLSAILMGATMLITQEGPEWPRRGIASRILTSGARMDGIIKDLVDLTRSRLGAGIPVVRARIDLEVVCRQATEEIASLRPQADVHFEASGDLIGEWDGGRIGQVMSNLVGNAQQHGTAGAQVHVAARGEADRVVITVHNAGSAIPPDRLREIFDPFRQLEHARSSSKNLQSMGLGLYIAREIVVAHGGTLEVASSDAGTTFTVVLPRRV